jgi:hypothetical protein
MMSVLRRLLLLRAGANGGAGPEPATSGESWSAPYGNTLQLAGTGRCLSLPNGSTFIDRAT